MFQSETVSSSWKVIEHLPGWELSWRTTFLHWVMQGSTRATPIPTFLLGGSCICVYTGSCMAIPRCTSVSGTWSGVYTYTHSYDCVYTCVIPCSTPDVACVHLHRHLSTCTPSCAHVCVYLYMSFNLYQLFRAGKWRHKLA